MHYMIKNYKKLTEYSSKISILGFRFNTLLDAYIVPVSWDVRQFLESHNISYESSNKDAYEETLLEPVVKKKTTRKKKAI